MKNILVIYHFRQKLLCIDLFALCVNMTECVGCMCAVKRNVYNTVQLFHNH